MLKKILVPLIALAGAACSPPAGEQPPAAEAPAAEPAESLSATGTVTAVDAAAGTISINHEAIAAVSWPAMEMQFTVEDPAILQGIAVGDTISFELKSIAEPQTIASVRKQ